jgi:type II secretory pathway component GspD/PulD (secretin)
MKTGTARRVALLLVVCFAIFPLCAAEEGDVETVATLAVSSGALDAERFPGASKKMSVDLRKMDIIDVLKLLAIEGDLNIVASRTVAGAVTLLLKDVSVGDAFQRVLSANDLAYKIEGNVINVMPNKEYRALYGDDFYDQRETRIFNLKYASAEKLANLLGNVKSDVGKIIFDDNTGMLVLVDVPAKIEMMEMIIAQSEIPTVSRLKPTVTQVFELKYAKLEDIQAEVKNSLTPEMGSFHVDKRTNSLVVTDLPYNMEKLAVMIKTFDRKPRVVFIEAKIVEVALGDTFQAGVDWNRLMDFDINSRNGKGSTYSITPQVNLPLGLNSGIAKLSLASVGSDRLNAVLDLIKSVTDVKILSNPHLLVENNKEASIKVIHRQPYQEEETITPANSATTTTRSYKFVDVGLTLNVTPTISSDGYISLKVAPQIGSIAEWYGGVAQSAGAVPVVKTANAETTVTIKDGVSIIIAGLIKDQKEKTHKGVPGISSFPIFGRMFRSESESVTRTETIIFLTPRIVEGDQPVELLRQSEKQIKGVLEDDTKGDVWERPTLHQPVLPTPDASETKADIGKQIMGIR